MAEEFVVDEAAARAQRAVETLLEQIAKEPSRSVRRQMRKRLGSALRAEWRSSGCQKVGWRRRVLASYVQATGQKLDAEAAHRVLSDARRRSGRAK